MTTKPLEIRRGRIRVNADTTLGKLVIDVTHRGKKVKSFEVSGVNALNSVFRIPIGGEIVLRLRIKNTRIFSLEAL